MEGDEVMEERFQFYRWGNFGGEYIKIKIKGFKKSENREKCR